MALVLGVRIGDVLDIDDYWIRVHAVHGHHQASLICDDGRRLSVTSHRLTRLMPEVWIGLGPDPAGHQLRLIFEAPRYISITRRQLSQAPVTPKHQAGPIIKPGRQ
jgi:hypothetical protein